MAALYRFFDSAGNLLYVGIAVVPMRRIGQHATQSLWFDEVTKITIDRRPDIDECRKMEKKAIKSEAPKYNILGAKVRGVRP